jgi:glycosyltransferase involved in cell wall biosynthesis
MMVSLRIALVVDPISALIGGRRHPLELSGALGRRGHEVRVFGLPPGWLSGDDTPPGPAIERRLGPSVMSFEPDGVVAYDARSPAAWLGARVAKRRGVPLVLVESEAWRERSRVQRALWSIGERLFGRFVRRTAGAVVALDAASHNSSLARGFAAERVAVVPPGVDLQRYRPGLASDSVARRHIRGRVLCCRLPRDAGVQHELMIEAFARTVGQRDDWSLVILGERPASPVHRSAAERRGIGPRVHFLTTDDVDVPELLSSSTLFAAPLDQGRALIDVGRALACGLPVLAVDSARMRCWIRHGEHGLFAAADDLPQWTAALREASMSPERRKRWGRAARTLAQERFSWEAIAHQFERRLGLAGATGEPCDVELPEPASSG